MAKQIYARIFGIEGGKLQSWSSPIEKVIRDHGDTHNYGASLVSQVASELGGVFKLIAWEHSGISVLPGEDLRLKACVESIQMYRSFEGWSAAVPDCPALQEALREVGINIDLDPSTESVGPRKPKPIVCPEIWHTKPFNPAEAWAATMQACKGGGTR